MLAVAFHFSQSPGPLQFAYLTSLGRASATAGHDVRAWGRVVELSIRRVSICYFGCGKSTTRSPGPGVVKRSIGLFSPSLSSSLPVDVTQ
jgi:hypothetical protein